MAISVTAQQIPRPEHPQPQMKRSEWMNLNGTWEFAETDDSKASFLDNQVIYPDKIVVPFCRESKLSGLERRGFVTNVWYRRTFELPGSWKSPRTRLHVGACDWYTKVYINGTFVGEHKGGSAPFAFDITKQLKPGKNTVVIHAFDDTRSGLQALGKQCPQLESVGCQYTRTTGIWQTVWLEGVGSTFIKDFRIDPSADYKQVFIQANVDGPDDGLTFTATAYANGKEVGTAKCPADWRNNKCVMNLSTTRLWSPTDAFLYVLKLKLMRGNEVVDSVDSYFGLRTVTIKGAAILINNKPIFQRTILDQGFYPDGIWTAPSDAALKRDIELSMAAGFNGARLHQKVFEPRFLYWADKMGYLVWGEFPSWGPNYDNPEVVLPIVNEWNEILIRDRNHPSIIGWCPFNESGGKFMVELQNTVVNLTRTVDPSRPVIDASGWTHGLPDPEVMDGHDYDQNPQTFRTRWMSRYGLGVAIPARYDTSRNNEELIPYFVSEYGGTGWDAEGGWGYGNAPKSMEEFYERYEGLTNALLDNRYMFGFSYTQLTDVEQEKNGLYFYDRTPKFDVARLKKITSRVAAYEKDPPFAWHESKPMDWKVLVGANPDKSLAREWSYTIEKPADDWFKPEFDASSWQKGYGGFGEKDGWESYIRTPWSTSDIWLRQEFTVNSLKIDKSILVVHYDNGTEVYLNGVQIWKGEGWNDKYSGFEVTEAVKKAIKPGKNVIAIHCNEEEGGQYIDAALLVTTK